MDQNTETYSGTTVKIEAKILLYKHIVVFIAINLFLCLINLICSARISWALWPILGWGILIAAHIFYVVFHTQDLKECMIKKEIAREEKKKSTTKK